MQEAIKRAIKQDTKNETVDNSAKDFGEPSKLHWDDSDTEDNDSKSKQRRRGVKPCAKQILLIPGIAISRKNCNLCFFTIVMGRTPFHQTSNKLGHHFSNIEQT